MSITVANGRGGISECTWTLKKGQDHPFTLYDLADRLRVKGWQVPAYPMAGASQRFGTAAQGARLGVSHDLAEDEDESAYQAEAEDEISPVRKIYPDAMMEHLGELAFEAESEEEAAEQFLPLIGMAASKLLPVAARALAPLARKALPKIARAVTKATPQLTRGIGKVAKTLYRTPQTRHLLKTGPAIARRTVRSIARQAAHGRHITPRTAIKTLARQARHVLAHPKHRRYALRRHAHLERNFHRRYGAGGCQADSRAASFFFIWRPDSLRQLFAEAFRLSGWESSLILFRSSSDIHSSSSKQRTSPFLF
ncbi:MAG: hypothetical protein WA672_08195 [Candidatus Angelobacter sp.]